MSIRTCCKCAIFAALVACAPSAGRALAGPGGQLKIEVVDGKTHEPIACRMHLTNAAHKSLKAPRVPFWHDHFVFSGDITLKLPKGQYAFEIERGLEYLLRSGQFTMDDFSNDTKVVELNRFVDMAAEGWWSGDVDVRRPAKDLELLMQAEDLHVVELVSWPAGKALLAKFNGGKNPLLRFDENRYIFLSAGADARAGGTLLFFGLDEPMDTTGFKPEFPSQQEIIERAKGHSEAWVDVARAYSWDLPIWVACGGVDSIELANSNLGRKSAINSEAPGRPRDTRLFPEPHGNGRWVEKIYYHLLNCGLRIPPTAGSGSGAVANPLGYNRTYAYVEGEFNYERWWEAVRAGRVVVTNGPLIRPNVEGEAPGHVFEGPDGQEIELEIGLNLATRDRVQYLEIIKNGELAQQYRLDEWASLGGKLPPLKFAESGWFLVRAVTSVPETYRFASTGPYYVELGGKRRISKSSAEFFLSWLDERTANLKLDDSKQREAVLKYHRQAQAFWREMVEKANAK